VNWGGLAIAQESATAEFRAMPQSAVNYVKDISVLEPGEISECLNRLGSKGK